MEENRDLTQRSTPYAATNRQKDFGDPNTIRAVFAEYPHPDPPAASSTTTGFGKTKTATASPGTNWGSGEQRGATPPGQAKYPINVQYDLLPLLLRRVREQCRRRDGRHRRRLRPELSRQHSINTERRSFLTGGRLHKITSEHKYRFKQLDGQFDHEANQVRQRFQQL